MHEQQDGSNGTRRAPGRAWRGTALVAGCAAAALAAPPLAVTLLGGPASAAAPAMSLSAHDRSTLGIAPLSAGGASGAPIVASAAVERLASAPRRTPAAAARLAQATAAPVTIVPVRLRGRIDDGLINAIAASGLSEGAARAFLAALAGRLDLARDISPDDHFDLVIASRGTAPDGGQAGELLYAAVDRAGASDVRLLRWRGRWLDTAHAEQRSGAMRFPVAGRISSGFGLRYHPILHFARMHKGVDFAAGWGQPIHASADGVVTRAGWAGGYGRQVRIAHGGGMASSYSHLGRMTVAPGTPVRAGQLIGYVGSSGLSTGPHLHYEVTRGGAHVDPLGARLAAASPVARADLDRFRARVASLLALRPSPPPAPPALS